uniref:Uncharacterized protein n=1 Tax=Triticum urartu TaxID=4572 RepID=A0A8R7U0E1_TRIUA
MPLCNVQWRATNSWAAVGDTSSPPRVPSRDKQQGTEQRQTTALQHRASTCHHSDTTRCFFNSVAPSLGRPPE